MKVGFYVHRVANAPGFENVVSSHVQLPLHTMGLLRDAGHEVQLITTESGESMTMPNCLPRGVTVHQVSYGSRQGNDPVMTSGNRSGVRIHKLVQQIVQTKNIVADENYDVLHFSGSNRIAYLAGLISLVGVSVPIVLTLNTAYFPERFTFLNRHLWERISTVITSTDFFKSQCEAEGIPARLIRHGVVRDIRQETLALRLGCPRHRVLYWRDPSSENGADICLQVYERLAPKYRDVAFDLAVRPHWNPVPQIRTLCKRHPNVNLHEFPYPQGTTIGQLMAESICVLLPFRELSTHPQLAVLETMQFGRAVITTEVGSNSEVIDSGLNGYLVPPDDVLSTVKAVERLLSDRALAAKIGNQAAEDIARRWNWNTYLAQLMEVYAAVIG